MYNYKMGSCENHSFNDAHGGAGGGGIALGHNAQVHCYYYGGMQWACLQYVHILSENFHNWHTICCWQVHNQVAQTQTNSSIP